MGSKLPEIQRPNHLAITGMPPRDLFEVREYYIVRLVEARRRNDSDTMTAAIDWIVALTSEMRIRGGRTPDPDPPVVTL